MDTIFINNLEVQTSIGITDEERSTPQMVHVSAELASETRPAAASDDIEDTIDYETVCNLIKDIAKTPRNTVERLAEDVAQGILDTYQPASVSVRITKFVLNDTDGVGVSITRP